MSKFFAPTKPIYIWQRPDWPVFEVDSNAIAKELEHARHQQSLLAGLLAAIGVVEKQELMGDLWIEDTVATAAIEGEKLDVEAVRSSVHRRLGLSAERPRDRSVEGLVDTLQDASKNFNDALTHERLHAWHASVFQSGGSALHKIAVGKYREHVEPMQIVSGLPGRETIHYVAPPSKQVKKEMQRFLYWFEKTRPSLGSKYSLNGLVRAAVAHLWFETIHPFEDGNGRIGRAIIDLAIAQDRDQSARILSLAKQFLVSRKEYYLALERAQTGTMDVTQWVTWFLNAVALACIESQKVVNNALCKASFWQMAARINLNDRQRKILNRLIESGDGGFLGGMTAEKYSKITGASKATATRDLVSLLEAKLLVTTGQGRATRYAVAVQGWNKEIETTG
jgi:Fic family protein